MTAITSALLRAADYMESSIDGCSCLVCSVQHGVDETVMRESWMGHLATWRRIPDEIYAYSETEAGGDMGCREQIDGLRDAAQVEALVSGACQ